MSNYESHPDWVALCKAVIAAPDDDLPRLVAADWLDENGQPGRAFLVRSQIADDGPKRWMHQTGRAAEFILDPMLFGCVTQVELAPARPGVAYTVERGFLSRVECPFEVWRDIGPALARVNPLASLIITDKQPEPYAHRWHFIRNQPAFADSQLPWWLFPHFKNAIREHHTIAHGTIRFSKRQDAHAALSAAYIAWARAAAEDTGRVHLLIDQQFA